MKQLFNPSDIYRVNCLSEPVISPDCLRIAYVKTFADKDENRFLSSVHIIHVDDNTQSGITLESHLQKSPAWSPDGRTFSFLAERNGLKQIWTTDVEHEAFTQVTSMRHGVESYVWSPDSRFIVFQCTLHDAEIENGTAFSELAGEDRETWIREKAKIPIEISEIMYKFDGEGILDGSRSCIGIVGADGSNPYILPVKFPCLKPAWSYDSAKLAFFGRPYNGVKARRNELFSCGRGGDSLTQLTEGAHIPAENPPCFTLDGKDIIYDLYPELPDGGTVQTLYKVSVSGSEQEELFDRESESCYGIHGFPASRTVFGLANPCYRLGKDGKTIYYRSAWKGGEGLFRLGIEDKKVEAVKYGKFSIQEFALDADDETACIIGKPDQIGALYYRDRKLTDSNPWLANVELGTVEELMVESRDGSVQIQGWVMKPPGMKQEMKYPAVLEIRGGPESTSTADFWHEYQALAAEGIVVLYCNPRGGMGYGPSFNSGGSAWDKGGDDLIDFVQAAVGLGFIDENRFGVTGGSYGGYMSTKLISTTKLFSAAVLQRTLCNTSTSYGTGDIGFASMKGPVPDSFRMLDFMTERARKSLICKVDSIKVPVLLLHGYNDYRCSFEQSEQLFIAMKERSPEIPVRLVMFPGEDHGITRTGKPMSQVRHLQEIVEWFKKYLVDEPWGQHVEGVQHEA